MSSPLIRLGTRKSPLALRQAGLVKESLEALNLGLRIELVPFSTRGDELLMSSLVELGGKGLFTQEIEQALYEGRIDGAVHSMKDLPTKLPDGMMIGAVLSRADPRDVLIGPDGITIDTLKKNASVGTASLRRQAQLLHHRPDLRISVLRGNVGTRLRRIEEGAFDATILAAAGLKRLGKETFSILSIKEMLPAAGQGIIGVECRTEDTNFRDILSKIHHGPTGVELQAERSFLERLDGSCRTPIGALAQLEKSGKLSLEGLVSSPDGQELHRLTRQGPKESPQQLGADLANQLIEIVGAEDLKSWRIKS
ncbi:MAG: hydroxymethylbilane synthase [bacterium]|nr:hydroxymethylbilane synthase [bacterium]